jgi:hypothetical protein
MLGRFGGFAIAALTVVAGGCSKADTAPAVAKVTVTPGRTSEGQGAPIEITYRFDVLPGAAIAADYRVFVHVLNADRQPLWDDDHDPPIPTSRWKPGQVVEYSRFGFIPRMATPGEATIEAGLYRDNTRLPLEGPDPSSRGSLTRAYRVAALQIQPQASNVKLILMSGWHPEESLPTDPTRTWAWTKKAAVLSFANPRADSLFYLQYDARPDLFAGHPQQISVSLDGKPLETFAADSATPVVRRIPITTATFGAAEMVTLKIETDQTFIPASLPQGSRDPRELGIRVYHTFLETPITQK